MGEGSEGTGRQSERASVVRGRAYSDIRTRAIMIMGEHDTPVGFVRSRDRHTRALPLGARGRFTSSVGMASAQAGRYFDVPVTTPSSR